MLCRSRSCVNVISKYVKYLSQYLGQAPNGEHENYLARGLIHWLTQHY